MQLDFNLREQTLWLEQRAKLVAGSRKYIGVRIHPQSPDWDDVTSITAYFQRGGVTYSVPVENWEIRPDRKLSLYAGVWDISLVGENASGKRITTNSCQVTVAPAPPGTEGSNTPFPDPPAKNVYILDGGPAAGWRN